MLEFVLLTRIDARGVVSASVSFPNPVAQALSFGASRSTSSAVPSAVPVERVLATLGWALRATDTILADPQAMALLLAPLALALLLAPLVALVQGFHVLERIWHAGLGLADASPPV